MGKSDTGSTGPGSLGRGQRPCLTAGVCRDDGAEVGFGSSWARTLVSIWTMEEAREGVGRRRFKEKEIRRTLAMQRKDARKKNFASRVQDPWNSLSDSVKIVKTPQSFMRS